MVSPVDGPGPAPGLLLPVPADSRSVAAFSRTQRDEQAQRDPQAAAGGRTEDRRRETITEAVATPIRQDVARGNPFQEQREVFRRPIFGTRPASSFLAQAIGQDTNPNASQGARTGSREAADRYRSVQDAVDRDTARRLGPPGVDIEV